MTINSNDSINQHYGRNNISQRILEALTQSGANINALNREDLSRFDEFHIGGLSETRALAKIGQLSEGMKLLDIGSGVGGPARTLAAEYGCNVTGIDLTEEYCRAARMLTERVELDDKVQFVHGNALDMPFDDESFDVVWTQHTSMNIENKDQLFSESFRLLRPGGKLLLHDIMLTESSNDEIHYPVLWASDSSISFLCKPEQTRSMLESTGFTVLEWIDKTDDAIQFWKERLSASQSDAISTELDLRVIVSENFSERAANVARNLMENRLAVIQAALQRD